MLKSDDVAKHVRALERAIGVVPHGSSLRRMPKWAQLQEACAGVTLSESVAGMPWSVQSLGLFTRAMRWGPAERASWEEVLSSQFISMVASPLPAIENECSMAEQMPNQQHRVAIPTGASQPSGSQISESSPPGIGGFCKCYGNCGSRVHKKLANSKHRGYGVVQVCTNPMPEG